VTLVEFALILPVFLTLILGLVDLGYRQYMNAMLSGTLIEAAREVTVGGVTQGTVTGLVTSRMKVIAPNATVTVVPSSYYDYTHIGTMDPITTDQNGNGVLDSGDCFLDQNADGKLDPNTGVANSLGNSDDIVYYLATANYPSFVPLQGLLGWGTTETVSATTMMRNQPYGSQPDPPTVCKS
jgi:Flp pilus assembly protein TadG